MRQISTLMHLTLKNASSCILIVSTYYVIHNTWSLHWSSLSLLHTQLLCRPPPQGGYLIRYTVLWKYMCRLSSTTKPTQEPPPWPMLFSNTAIDVCTYCTEGLTFHTSTIVHNTCPPPHNKNALLLQCTCKTFALFSVSFLFGSHISILCYTNLALLAQIE